MSNAARCIAALRRGDIYSVVKDGVSVEFCDERHLANRHAKRIGGYVHELDWEEYN